MPNSKICKNHSATILWIYVPETISVKLQFTNTFFCLNDLCYNHCPTVELEIWIHMFNISLDYSSWHLLVICDKWVFWYPYAIWHNNVQILKFSDIHIAYIITTLRLVLIISGNMTKPNSFMLILAGFI